MQHTFEFHLSACNFDQMNHSSTLIKKESLVASLGAVHMSLFRFFLGFEMGLFHMTYLNPKLARPLCSNFTLIYEKLKQSSFLCVLLLLIHAPHPCAAASLRLLNDLPLCFGYSFL